MLSARLRIQQRKTDKRKGTTRLDREEHAIVRSCRALTFLRKEKNAPSDKRANCRGSPQPSLPTHVCHYSHSFPGFDASLNVYSDIPHVHSSPPLLLCRELMRRPVAGRALHVQALSDEVLSPDKINTPHSAINAVKTPKEIRTLRHFNSFLPK